MGWQLRWSTPSRGYTVLRRAPTPARDLKYPRLCAQNGDHWGRRPDLGHSSPLIGKGSTRCEPSDRRHVKVRQQQMQLSDFPRFCQRGLQATYFHMARLGLLPGDCFFGGHHWLSRAAARDCSSYKRLRRSTSSKPPTTVLHLYVPLGKWRAKLLLLFINYAPASRRRRL